VAIEDSPPEAAYRAFLFANLSGDETYIRPLIVERPGMEVLWKQPFPAEVALVLGFQYSGMQITRLAETTSRVSLVSTAAPSPLEAVFEGERWRIDPTPLIRLRQSGAE
jgi:hypothetical protein